VQDLLLKALHRALAREETDRDVVDKDSILVIGDLGLLTLREFPEPCLFIPE
jgi:hypothetical protein